MKRTILVACTAVALTSGEHPAFPATMLGYGYGQAAGQGEPSGPVMDLRGLLPAAPLPALGQMFGAPTTEAPAPEEAPQAAATQFASTPDGAQGLAACAGDGDASRNDLSASHRTLPLDSMALVTDLDTKKEVIVRVNARGPGDSGKVIALSPNASAALGCGASGEARVSVRYLGPGSRVPVRTASAAKPAPAYAPAPVQAAPLRAEAAAYPPAPRGAYVVQIGAYSERANAERARERADGAGRVSIEQAATAGGVIYRVRLGPWEDRDDAERARRKAAHLGFHDARIATR